MNLGSDARVHPLPTKVREGKESQPARNFAPQTRQQQWREPLNGTEPAVRRVRRRPRALVVARADWLAAKRGAGRGRGAAARCRGPSDLSRRAPLTPGPIRP